MVIGSVKRAIAYQLPVTYRENEYFVTGITMRIRDGEWYYQLELHEMKANAILIADMEKVILKGEQQNEKNQ